jgi:hypothetical protein
MDLGCNPGKLRQTNHEKENRNAPPQTAALPGRSRTADTLDEWFVRPAFNSPAQTEDLHASQGNKD